MVGVDQLTHYGGVPSERLASRLGVPQCLALKRVGSVLDVVHDLADHGAPDGTAVLADEQTAGRGRQGRRWHSPAGAGIWLGYLKRPGPASEGGVLSLRVGLAVRDVLAQFGVTVCLKWPNDLLVCDRKLGGILCEARWSGAKARWVAVGIGLNVRSPVPPELSHRAIALDEVWRDARRIVVLEKLLPMLARLPASSELTEAEMNAYAAGDWLRGRALAQPFAGTVRGIDSDGALLVETETRIRRVLGGSVVGA